MDSYLAVAGLLVGVFGLWILEVKYRGLKAGSKTTLKMISLGSFYALFIKYLERWGF